MRSKSIITACFENSAKLLTVKGIMCEISWSTLTPFLVRYSINRAEPGAPANDKGDWTADANLTKAASGAQNTGPFESILLCKGVSILIQFVSFLFSIPQKLSNRTLSKPCSHRTTTSTASFSSWSLILKPNTGFRGESDFVCPFRLAALDQTFSLAKPTPVLIAGWNRHRISRDDIVACNVATWFPMPPFISITYSAGEGSNPFGTELELRATA